MEIRHDVAGATFMAVGLSLPGFVTGVVGMFVAQSIAYVKFGSIVGSAVFNMLIVIAVCGFAAKKALR